MEREVQRRLLGAALVFFSLTFPNFASAEVFVADFNGDGKPDVLMSSPSAPEGFVVLLNQGEWDGKMTFRKTWPEIKSTGGGATLPTYPTAPTASNYTPPAYTQPAYTPPALPPAGTTGTTTTWTPTPAQTTSTWTPPAARPAIAPPPVPTISTSTPKLKTMGGESFPPAAPNTKMSASMPGSEKNGMKSPMSEPATQNWTFGSHKVALFNYKDKTTGSQFAWLERGIANILKFDVMEVKNVQLIDRERTDLTFDPAWFRGSGLAADVLITGEFEEAADRLIVTTWFLTPSMSAVREFKVEGDRADIFSLIEKVGSRLKQELTSL